MDWYPEPGETSLFRGAVSFASGRASKVRDMRWFRDDQGRDIEGELPGWPPGPVFARRSEKKATSENVAKGVLFGAAVVAGSVLGAIGGGADGSALTAYERHYLSQGKPKDPETEIKDFPVMWAPFGTVARTLPWQADPGRRPEGYFTDLQVTDKRLLILGYFKEDRPAEVLWQLPISQVAGAQQHAFAARSGDATIGFADGSWVRLDVGSPARAFTVAWVLSGNLEPLALTEAQRDRIAGSLASHRKSYPKAVVDVAATPAPGVPPGIVGFDLVRRNGDGNQYKGGNAMLKPDGEYYLSAELQKKK